MDNVREANMGFKGALDFLSQHQEGVSSKDVCQALDISSARMAILLKKLEAKGFVEKSKSTTDRRSTTIVLTPSGQQFVHIMQERVAQTSQRLIDEFGFDTLVVLIAQMGKFHSIMHQEIIYLSEESHD